MVAICPASADELEMNIAKKAYIDECTKNIENVLPTLLKIREQNLVLNFYQLTDGICSGL